MEKEKSVMTPKGTVLPLLNLRGKFYLMGAYRLQWLNEEVKRFTIETEFFLVTDDQTIAKATVTIYNDDGHLIKKATATKRETKKDFPDHTEKAESSAIFRALASLGYGTQYALSDLDEGVSRLADSPLEPAKGVSHEAKVANMLANPQAGQQNADLNAAALKNEVRATETPLTGENKQPTAKSNSFRKPKEPKVVTPAEESEWS